LVKRRNKLFSKKKERLEKKGSKKRNSKKVHIGERNCLGSAKVRGGAKADELTEPTRIREKKKGKHWGCLTEKKKKKSSEQGQGEGETTVEKKKGEKEHRGGGNQKSF